MMPNARTTPFFGDVRELRDFTAKTEEAKADWTPEEASQTESTK